MDYGLAGYQLQIHLMCTAPIVEREALARDVLQVDGVVEIQEIMTGRQNIGIKAVIRVTAT